MNIGNTVTNPFAEHAEPIQSMTDLFGNYRLVPAKKGQSERGILLQYFSGKLGIPIPFIAFKLTKLVLPDLYYIKSAADAYENEGKGPWSKAFNGMLKEREEQK